MVRVWLLVIAAVLALGMAPADAKRRSDGECSFPVPTGQALPRQADVTMVTMLAPRPFPKRDDEPVAPLKPGDRVTVREECGIWVKIETASHDSGWASVAVMPEEQRLIEAAATAASVADGKPDPCQHYLPTGAPLPREDFVSRDTPIYVLPNPTYRERPLDGLRGGMRATILKECGRQLRVRSESGVEGWASISLFNNEPRLYRDAFERPIASADECDIRYDDVQVARRCREKFVADAAHLAEMKASSFLTGEEISPFVSGKMFVLIEPGELPASAREPAYNYFAADGQYYLKTGIGGAGTNYRGRWHVRNSALCMPNAYQPCYRLLKTPSGTVKWMATFRGELTEMQGIEDPDSTARIVAEIDRYYPETPAELPPEDDDGSGLSAPAMGD